MRRGVNYRTQGWGWNGPTSDYDRDLAKFAKDGLSIVCLPLHWATIEGSVGVYNTSFLDRIIDFIERADSEGLLIDIDFHTLMAHPSYTMPGWLSNYHEESSDCFEAVFPEHCDGGSTVPHDTWLDMLAYVVDYLKGQSNIRSWHLMNEPYRGAWACDVSLDTFIELFIEMKETVVALDSRPITIRYAADGFRHVSSFNRDPRCMAIWDYVGFTWYEAYETKADFATTVATIHNNQKHVAVLEWGYKSTNDETQRAKYAEYIDWFINTLGVEGPIFPWVWRSDNCSGSVPLPRICADDGWCICANLDGDGAPSYNELIKELPRLFF